MKNKIFPEITTQRLLLRQLKTSDWEMISYLRSDKKVNEFIKRTSAESKEKALAFIARIHTAFKDQKSYYWVITAPPTSEMIGSICLWNFSGDRQKAEVGYDLSPQFQGKGMMTEALQNVLNFGFHQLHLQTIEAYTHHQNKNSKKLLETNGFELVKGKIDEDNLNNIIYRIKK